jgi:hypothetical protein
MKTYHYFTLFVALTISACAAYYSIVGLTAIFAAAVIPIVIMGSVLELAKITGAIWLKIYWHEATWWLKFYLVPAVAVLMVITSIGIFGFLSRAHIEQTSSAAEGVAQIERIDTEILQQQEIIAIANSRIADARSEGTNQDSAIQQQIDVEQDRIDSAYTRIQPAIDEQLQIIERADSAVQTRILVFQTQVNAIDEDLQNLAAALAANDVRRAQGIVGERQDGSLGPSTSTSIQQYRETQESRRNDLIAQIETIRTASNPDMDAARREIARLRSLAEEQIANSNQLINRLRSQLGTADVARTQQTVDQQLERISQASERIDQLSERKFELEAQRRVLEAEVGPIKYIAEMVYGSSDKDLLEEAVRWLILLLVIVFDPLAVILTLAAISGITNFGRATPEPAEVPVTVETVEKIVEVPVTVEKIVEVPVTVEKIVEVPVTLEVPVPYENTEKVNELAAEVEELLDTVERQKQQIIQFSRKQSVKNQPIAEPDFDLGDVSGASFGSTWPVNPTKGQLFLKVDTLPNKLYKWNGKKWIEVDIARIEDTLAYDVDYIKWLVNEIKHGRREYEELSDIEQSQIKSYIRTYGNSETTK